MRLLCGVLSCLLIGLTLSGCMFSEANLVENQMPPNEWMDQVQQAVDRYRADTGGPLPILTKDADTPLYEKYPIDFGKLVPKYLFTVPPNAFEKEGGNHRYVLVDVETQPKVKLIDLRVTQSVDEVQRAVQSFYVINGHLPIKELMHYGYFRIDYGKLLVKETMVQSPFTGSYLPLIMDRYGRVGVDYAADIQRLIAAKGEGLEAQQANRDLRQLLSESSWFLPADSFPYFYQDGEPVPQLLPRP